MKRLILSMAVLTLLATACKKNDDTFATRGTNAGNLEVVYETLPSIIDQDVFLTNDRVYLIDGKVYVDDGATMFIQEGTRLEGVRKNNTNEASALVVTRGGKILATGTSTDPIVFSAHQDDVDNPVLEPGDWGGVVLLGKAPVNKVEPTIEGINLPTVPAGIDVHYGGTDSLDSSGELQFVRIEYAGAAIALDNELNSLTGGGIGKGTILNHIECAYGADDAFEFFGGYVNAQYLFAYAPNDDAFDFDFGAQVNIQFGVSVLKTALGYSANPNGFEVDNDATGSSDGPITRVKVSNFTVIGLPTQADAAGKGLLNAALFRRNSQFFVKNSLFLGFPTGLNHGTANADKHWSHNGVHAYTTIVTPAPFPTQIAFGSDLTNDSFLGGDANTNIGLVAPFAATPDFRPAAGSAAFSTSGGETTSYTFPEPTGFTTVSYRGAFDATNNWLAGWAKYDY